MEFSHLRQIIIIGHGVEPALQTNLVPSEWLHGLIPPSKQVAPNVLYPGSAFQIMPPGIGHPVRARRIEVEAIAFENVGPQQIHIVFRGELHASTVGCKLPELKFRGQSYVVPYVPFDAVTGNTCGIRTWGAYES